MFKRRLACSFCGRGEAEVAKLVAGPRVYICDTCAVQVHRIMEESTNNEAGPSHSHDGLFRTMRVRIRGLWHRGVRRSVAHHAVPPPIADAV